MTVQDLIEEYKALPKDEQRRLLADMRRHLHDTDPARHKSLDDLPPNLRALYDEWSADPSNDAESDWTWDDILEYHDAKSEKCDPSLSEATA